MAPSIPLQEARRVRGLCCSAPGWAGFRGQPPSHAIVLCCSEVDTQSLIVLQHIATALLSMVNKEKYEQTWI